MKTNKAKKHFSCLLWEQKKMREANEFTGFVLCLFSAIVILGILCGLIMLSCGGGSDSTTETESGETETDTPADEPTQSVDIGGTYTCITSCYDECIYDDWIILNQIEDHLSILGSGSPAYGADGFYAETVVQEDEDGIFFEYAYEGVECLAVWGEEIYYDYISHGMGIVCWINDEMCQPAIYFQYEEIL